MIKKLSRKKQAQKLPSRITNETVAEHREQVLAGGRKHKYPVQYTRNALVRNAIIISVAALALLVLFVWLQLYVWKSTNDLAYRVTRAVPLPVASIDGELVRYSDYLMYHRSTITALESRGGASAATADRLQFQQQQAMDRALEDAYVRKLAREHGVSVSDEQVNALIEEKRKESTLPESSYAATVHDNFRWTMDELRRAVRSTLLRHEVIFKVDTDAAEKAKEIEKELQATQDLAVVAGKFGSAVEYHTDVVVPKDNSDGGLSAAAQKLEVGAVSGATKTLAGDGYYFILRQASDEATIKYSFLKVPLHAFQEQFEQVRKSDKTRIFIGLAASKEG